MMSGLIRNTVLILSVLATGSALALTDSEYFSERVDLGELPPLEERLPREPALVQTGEDFRPGRHGGRLRLLFGRAK
ncbi:MAG: ABC transporter substrate-binding protein, partial [Gammaproteobacteria bacterium]|nr:ABC transporter substrate-binding protein [Gammaproteobacteria bacterium]